ncbi:hypothetical protein [Salisediminibacterium selenitireducens]|uniref:Lipoprotein n=1 Tax=Bacillus selenitireducens (strain ATCC 700615 / DSM 15326 / MLS10) TaxID=439292 RepID=D6XV24_BACIE|nr:hypothetical protein [Salisediminibacterium selenitireducens]ADH97582.1 hypothetical protein Bsel_0031 [[Bacillus] selenitireducens MLS10]
MLRSLFVSLPAAFLITLSACGTEADQNRGNEQPERDIDHVSGEAAHMERGQETNNGAERNDETAPVSFTEQEAISLLHDYEETLQAFFEEAQAHGQTLESVGEIGEVENELTRILSAEGADMHLNTYFREEDGTVTVIPTEAPVWFDETAPYTFYDNEQGSPRLEQERENELIGHVRMIYSFSYDDRQETWRISDIDSEPMS